MKKDKFELKEGGFFELCSETNTIDVYPEDYDEIPCINKDELPALIEFLQNQLNKTKTK